VNTIRQQQIRINNIVLLQNTTTIVLLDIENIFLHIKHGCNVSSPLTPQHVHPTSSGPPSRQPRDVPRNTTAGSAHGSATAVSPPRTHSGDPVNKCITRTGQKASAFVRTSAKDIMDESTCSLRSATRLEIKISKLVGTSRPGRRPLYY